MSPNGFKNLRWFSSILFFLKKRNIILISKEFEPFCRLNKWRISLDFKPKCRRYHGNCQLVLQLPCGMCHLGNRRIDCLRKQYIRVNAFRCLIYYWQFHCFIYLFQRTIHYIIKYINAIMIKLNSRWVTTLYLWLRWEKEKTMMNCDLKCRKNYV